MSSFPGADGADDIPVELGRLRNAIANELHAQLALRGETIELADVPEVAYAVAVQLGHAFRVEWAPRWVDDREDDGSVGLDAATWYGSALPDGGNQERVDRYPVFDHGWPEVRR
ncbi:hypothetical protein ACI2K4_23215 [Micromonospora sp. NPDC050397]|uniref:hypothetical protein n=1 Tax=Micromonospora sp. NPDC050397 TaxID=3364279 RepID=UPI00384C4C88